MKTWKNFWFLGIFVIGLMATAGCESDPVAPQETYDVDAAAAEEWSLQAIAMISGMAATVPLAGQGDFSTLGPDKSAAAPTWDEVEMAWILDETTTYSEGDPPTTTGEIRYYVWIQFRGPEGPQPTPEGATEFEYREAAGMTTHAENEQGVSDLDFDLACSMVVSYLETGFAMDGLGEAEVTAAVTADDGTQNLNLAMNWGLDLVTLFEGCPAGTAYVEVGQYRTDVVYDGQGNADWTLVGPSYTADGTEAVPCGESR
jgi:hypothetical protein